MSTRNRIVASILALLLVGPVWGDGITNPGGSSSITSGTTPITCTSGTTGVLYQSSGKVACDSGLTYAGAGGAFGVTGDIQFVTNNPGHIKAVNFGSIELWGGSFTFKNYDSSGGILLNSTSALGVAFWSDTSGSAFTGRMGFGGTTNAFPAIARSGTTLQVKLADASADAPLEASAYINGGPVPTGNTGTCSTGVTVAGGSTVGTWTSTAICALAGTIILTAMPTAPTGYVCDMTDRTTSGVTVQQTATSATSATFTVRSLPTGSVQTVANDILQYKCMAY